jgi:hypothetical protein
MSAVSHPFARLPETEQRRAFTILVLAVFALTTFLAVLGAPLATPEAPRGIVSYELAGSGEAAAAIVTSWTPSVRRLALLNLALDYLYLIAYPALLALGCGRLAGRLVASSPGLARLGGGLAWVVLLSGVLDAIENAALIRMLVSGPSDALARLAWGAAVPKFALVGAALLYLLGGITWLGVSKLRSR